MNKGTFSAQKPTPETAHARDDETHPFRSAKILYLNEITNTYRAMYDLA